LQVDEPVPPQGLAAIRDRNAQLGNA